MRDFIDLFDEETLEEKRLIQGAIIGAALAATAALAAKNDKPIMRPSAEEPHVPKPIKPVQEGGAESIRKLLSDGEWHSTSGIAEALDIDFEDVSIALEASYYAGQLRRTGLGASNPNMLYQIVESDKSL